MIEEIKNDCVRRLELFLMDNPQANIKNVFDVVKANSDCYNCPQRDNECTASSVSELYQMQQASRGIPSGIEVTPNYELPKISEFSLYDWLKGKED